MKCLLQHFLSLPFPQFPSPSLLSRFWTKKHSRQLGCLLSSHSILAVYYVDPRNFGVSLLSEGSTSANRNPTNVKLELAWGSTMYHVDDLPFNPSSLPDIYTQFCKAKKEMCFVGGDSAALGRVYEYFWKKVDREKLRLGGAKISIFLNLGETALQDANMKELSTTAFASIQGRQFCSFLVRDMGIDWLLSAEWFEISWIMIQVQIMGTGHAVQVLGMIQERICKSVFPNK
ncbi:hypothetical protein C5167_048858 [Papaver somniferum]|uniref:Uncharacterized protein n=1 Tax=Papaver somniferum TaxID=3469 RepID=A0A4Y7KKJ2_PAPSO|nr:hypothetical protein C5167_048858 [Papaver somniferum]